MRWMRIFACLLAVSIFAVSVPRAQACSCVPPPPPPEALAQSDAVFAGRVTDIHIENQGPQLSSADPVRVSFRVERAWKGGTASTLQVTTPRDSASCGFNFEQGKDYIVYAGEQAGELTTGLCSRTALLSDASADLTALGQGQMVTLPATGSALLFDRVALFAAVVLAVMIVGVGAFLFARRTPRSE